MQHLEVSSAVQRFFKSLGFKGLNGWATIVVVGRLRVKENIENFLAGPDNEYSAVEAHKPTKNRFADQETQVEKAGSYTAKIIRSHSQASSRVESPG